MCAQTFTETENDLQIQVAVRPLKSSAGRERKIVNKEQLVDALTSLGYPIGRYLRQINADSEYSGGLTRIYARMRVVYYQNKTEFTRLSVYLKNRLQSMSTPELKAIARHAEGFVPMWQTYQQSHSALTVAKNWA